MQINSYHAEKYSAKMADLTQIHSQWRDLRYLNIRKDKKNVIYSGKRGRGCGVAKGGILRDDKKAALAESCIIFLSH